MHSGSHVNYSRVRLKCSPRYAGDQTTWLAALPPDSSDPLLQDRLYQVTSSTIRRMFSGDPIPTELDMDAIATAIKEQTGEPKKLLRFFP